MTGCVRVAIMAAVTVTPPTRRLGGRRPGRMSPSSPMTWTSICRVLTIMAPSMTFSLSLATVQVIKIEISFYNINLNNNITLDNGSLFLIFFTFMYLPKWLYSPAGVQYNCSLTNYISEMLNTNPINQIH